jgi:hypothetical protein
MPVSLSAEGCVSVEAGGVSEQALRVGLTREQVAPR